MTQFSAPALLGGLALLALAPVSWSAPAPAAAPAPAVAPSPAAAQAAAPANPTGPLVPGVCFLSREALITNSKAGQAAQTRLNELKSQIQASNSAEDQRLQARVKAFEAKRATLSPMQIQAQGEALNQRQQAIRLEAGQRGEQYQSTEAKAAQRVLAIANAYIVPIYTAHNCGLLLARESVISGNMGNDLTAEIAAKMDANFTPFSFDLEPPRATK